MLEENITLSIDLPSGKSVDLAINREKYFSAQAYKKSRDLHDIYENDYLFLPKNINGGVLAYLQDVYGQEKIQDGLYLRQSLENEVFGYIESLLDEVSFDCSFIELEKFCEQIIIKENEAMASSKTDDTLSIILQSKNKSAHLIKLTVQFAIEFLSEGSGMSSYVGGSYGEIQSNIFRIILDEMGEGIYRKKHSHLYEGTMLSLDLSDDPKYYRDFFDISTFTVTNFVYYLCQNKRFFFRFIGSLFRNEACFVNWQKQLGNVMESVFGKKIDRRYFDVHAIVDQDHGRWAFSTIINPAVKLYGESIIPEIIRGFISYKLYQELNDFEFIHGIEAYDRLDLLQNTEFKKGKLIDFINYEEKIFFINKSDVVVETIGDSAITVIHNMSEIKISNTQYVIPAYFPVWIEPKNSEVSIYEINLNL